MYLNKNRVSILKKEIDVCEITCIDEGKVSEVQQKQSVFRIEGLSCTNCAGKFERNVKELPGVKDAKVNFGASKITVIGETTIDELEKAGAFEHLKIYPEKIRRDGGEGGSEKERKERPSFFQKHQTLLFPSYLIVLGYISSFLNGEENLITILLFLSAMIIGGFSLFKEGFTNLLHLEFDMRTLMTIAIIGASIIGEWAEGAVVVILFAISEALERYSMEKARKSIQSLMEIAPKQALIRRDGKELLIPVENVHIGDIMIVKPGQKIALDGIVVKGSSTVNQAAITGEAIPVTKNMGDEVFSGTLNEEGLLEVKVTKYVEDTTISKIIEMVEEAQGERAPSQAFIDRFAKYYTPIIMFIALLVAIVPPVFFLADWGTWIYQGLSVLVVGCPCALVISTPISIVSAIGSAAKRGVLIKGGIFLEELGSVKVIAFDKTGTLTKGIPVVTDVKIFHEEYDERKILEIAYALERNSNHPLAKAIVRRAREKGIHASEEMVENFTSITGKGIQGTMNGITYYVGSPSLFKELSNKAYLQEISFLQSEGKSIMIVGTNEQVLGCFAIADEVRESSKAVMEKLHELGIQRTIMLTGDHRATAEAIGAATCLTEVKASLMPDEKLAYIKELQKDYGKVAMVGDGVNDAPALAAANVGIAMGGAGTDTALETADVALMADDLSKLPFTINLSRKTMRIIKTNIAFALGVKLFALLLVVPGWLTLWIAIFADMGATLLVSLNSMRLVRVKE